MEGLRQTGIKKLGTVVDSVLKKYGLDKKLKEVAVLNMWEDVVGEKISEVAKAVKIKKGILFVSVENSSWRSELNFMKNDIIKKLNNQLKEDLVKDILFR